MVTTGKGNEALPAQGEDFASAWREMRGNEDLQFAPVELPQAAEPEPQSNWLADMLDGLASILSPIARFFAASWPVLMWVLIAAFAGLIIYFLYTTYGPGAAKRARRKDAKQDEWAPQEDEALALLEEADRLAAAGDFDEATHLLLKRSVGQIAEARPDLVEPSSTARELASEPRLPEAARRAFSLIAAPVERSLFALRKLSQDDWQAARAAYADFALAQRDIQQQAIGA